MRRLQNIINIGLAIGAFVAMMYGAGKFFDTRYALAEEVEQIDTQVQLLQAQLAYDAALKHYYLVYELFIKKPNNVGLKEELESAKNEMEILKQKIINLKK